MASAAAKRKPPADRPARGRRIPEGIPTEPADSNALEPPAVVRRFFCGRRPIKHGTHVYQPGERMPDEVADWPRLESKIALGMILVDHGPADAAPTPGPADPAPAGAQLVEQVPGQLTLDEPPPDDGSPVPQLVVEPERDPAVEG